MATYLELKAGCKIHPLRNSEDECEYVVETADNSLFRLSEMSRGVLEELERGNSLEEVCDKLSQKYPGATSDELRVCILDMYRPLLRSREDREPEDTIIKKPLWKQNALFVQLTVIPESPVIALSKKLRSLYRPVPAFLILMCITGTHILFYGTHAGPATGLAGVSTAATLALCLLSVVAHELGHSSALLKGGGRPGGIGIGMFLLMPVFFADVSQVWLLTKRSRLIVDLGGVYFQQIVFALFAVCAAMFHIPEFRAGCIAIDVMCLIAINPAFRFDGYWLLADWLEVPKLNRAAHQFLKDLVKQACRRPVVHSKLPGSLRKSKAAAFIAYAFLGNGFLAAVVLLNLRSVRSSLQRAYEELPKVIHQLTFAYRVKDWATVTNSAVSLWFICALVVALIGMIAIYLYKSARAFLQWHSARSRPNSPSQTSIVGGLQ